MKNQEKVTAIEALLKKTLNEHHLQNGLDLVHIKKTWTAVMGPGVASYTTSVEFNKGLLLVSLNSSVLREELSYGLEKMIALLNEQLGQSLIKKIKLN